MLAKFNAEKLRTARKEKKFTQERLAEQANFSDRYIRALENGENDNPSASLVCQVSKALDIPMESLMEEVPETDED